MCLSEEIVPKVDQITNDALVHVAAILAAVVVVGDRGTWVMTSIALRLVYSVLAIFILMMITCTSPLRISTSDTRASANTIIRI